MNRNIAVSMTNPHAIRVGNLGTNPVCQYSMKTGTMKPILVSPSTPEIIPKNLLGL